VALFLGSSSSIRLSGIGDAVEHLAEPVFGIGAVHSGRKAPADAFEAFRRMPPVFA
jgi:hypothetical protein